MRPVGSGASNMLEYQPSVINYFYAMGYPTTNLEWELIKHNRDDLPKDEAVFVVDGPRVFGASVLGLWTDVTKQFFFKPSSDITLAVSVTVF